MATTYELERAAMLEKLAAGGYTSDSLTEELRRAYYLRQVADNVITVVEGEDIQDAVDAANSGYVVQVYPKGTEYAEDVVCPWDVRIELMPNATVRSITYRQELTVIKQAAAGYVLPVYVRRGDVPDEQLPNGIACGGLCEKDFSDVYFTDSEGTALSYRLVSHGNYEITPDSNLKKRRHIVADAPYPGLNTGDIVAFNSTGLAISTDGGATWGSIIATFTGYLLGMDRHGAIYYSWLDAGGANDGLYRLDYDVATSAWNTPVRTVDCSSYAGTWFLPMGFAEDNSGGTYDGYLYAGLYGGEDYANVVYIYRSVDNGETWTQVFHDEETYTHVHGLIVDQMTGDIYAGLDSASGDRAMIRSQDGGTTWTDDFFVDLSGDVCALVGLQDRIIFGAGGAGVFDGNTMLQLDRWAGVSFAGATTPASLVKGNGTVQYMSQIGDTIIAAVGAWNIQGYSHILLSDDRGKTWSVAWWGGVDPNAQFVGPIYTSNVANDSIILGAEDEVTAQTYTPLRMSFGGDHHQALFLVKLPAIEELGTSIYACYGNPDHGNTQVLEDIFDTTALDEDADLICRYKFDGDCTDEMGNFDLTERETTPGEITYPLGNGARKGIIYPRIQLPGRHGANTVTAGWNAACEDGDDLDLLASFTLVGWVRGLPMESPARQTIISRGNNLYSVSSQYGLLFSAATAPEVKFVYNGAPSNYVSATNPRYVLDGQWHQIGVVVGPVANDKQSIQFIFDGVLDTAVDLGETLLAGDRHRLSLGMQGKSSATDIDETFGGDFDDWRVYGRVLTSYEIETLYWGHSIQENPPEFA